MFFAPPSYFSFCCFGLLILYFSFCSFVLFVFPVLIAFLIFIIVLVFVMTKSVANVDISREISFMKRVLFPGDFWEIFRLENKKI